MDGKTLMASMTYSGYPAPLSLARYTELADDATIAMQQANCTTVNRVAMMLAQVGAESGSLRWTEELADGSAYNGRLDLGNTEPGDGPRFKGRSFIQITGRSHYTNLSKWAFSKGIVPTSTYFIDHPTALAYDKYVWLGPVWYWVVARPQLNSLADRKDINAATYAVNGGYNNLSGRTARWNKCLTLGSALLAGSSVGGDPDMFVYRCGTSYFLFAGGQRVRHVGSDYAANISKMIGRPIGTVSWAMHQRMVKDQAGAASGGGLK